MVSSIPMSTQCLDFTITSPRMIIGWNNVLIVLFHKEAQSWSWWDGPGGGAVWLWEGDICVSLSVDGHAAS